MAVEELLDAALTPRQEQRRRRVIKAARKLAATGGYDAVQMREVAAAADVALGTIYRYFSSKDALLAAAMAEWTSELQELIARTPPAGGTPADRLVEVLRRACDSMEAQPKLSAALVRALASADDGVAAGSADVNARVAAISAEILDHLDPETRADVLAVLGHVWYSALVGWVNGRTRIEDVGDELERAARLLLA
ncbi:MAG TPA: TetR family transcriptional regulator [Acidimicrobiia bacterium]|nr:TetR family transcriptional regulator [Acidimicrobiia bacterium]